MDYRLLALLEIKKQIKNTKAYDGWDEDYMLERFIKKNGYNPSEEFKKLNDVLLKEYLPTELKAIFVDLRDNHEVLKELEKFKEIESKLLNSIPESPNKLLIMSFLLQNLV